MREYKHAIIGRNPNVIFQILFHININYWDRMCHDVTISTNLWNQDCWSLFSQALNMAKWMYENQDTLYMLRSVTFLQERQIYQTQLHFLFYDILFDNIHVIKF